MLRGEGGSARSAPNCGCIEGKRVDRVDEPGPSGGKRGGDGEEGRVRLVKDGYQVLRQAPGTVLHGSHMAQTCLLPILTARMHRFILPSLNEFLVWTDGDSPPATRWLPRSLVRRKQFAKHMENLNSFTEAATHGASPLSCEPSQEEIPEDKEGCTGPRGCQSALRACLGSNSALPTRRWCCLRSLESSCAGFACFPIHGRKDTRRVGMLPRSQLG